MRSFAEVNPVVSAGGGKLGMGRGRPVTARKASGRVSLPPPPCLIFLIYAALSQPRARADGQRREEERDSASSHKQGSLPWRCPNVSSPHLQYSLAEGVEHPASRSPIGRLLARLRALIPAKASPRRTEGRSDGGVTLPQPLRCPSPAQGQTSPPCPPPQLTSLCCQQPSSPTRRGGG